MARDVKEHSKDMDGLAKNLDKLHKEADVMIAAVKAENKTALTIR